MIVIGIDLGLSGALAAVDHNGLRNCANMPIMLKGKGGGKVKNEVNPAGLTELLREWASGHSEDLLVVIEKVSSMPSQGVASMFSMGDTLGCVRGVLAARGYSVEWITPQTWKKHYGLKLDGDSAKAKNRASMMKELSRARAIQLYPEADLARKADHNRAEAILIAKYGYERFA